MSPLQLAGYAALIAIKMSTNKMFCRQQNILSASSVRTQVTEQWTGLGDKTWTVVNRAQRILA